METVNQMIYFKNKLNKYFFNKLVNWGHAAVDASGRPTCSRAQLGRCILSLDPSKFIPEELFTTSFSWIRSFRILSPSPAFRHQECR
jgi:hypothetical protein